MSHKTNFDDIKYNEEYHCNNVELFQKLINELEGKNLTKCYIKYILSILPEYIKAGGSLNDYLIYDGMAYIEHYCGIPDAVIKTGCFELFKQMLELNPELINYHNNEYYIVAIAINYKQYQMAEYLLDNGANPNAQGKRYRAPLYQAINSGNVNIVKKLLEKGANPNLTHSVFTGNVNIVKKGANLNLTHPIVNLNYLTYAIHLYTKYNHYKTENTKEIIKLLINANAKVQENELEETEKKLYNSILQEKNSYKNILCKSLKK